jgi:diguanylate cyclase (GGDEF)-like protein
MFFLAFGFVLSSVEQASEQNRRFALEDALTELPNRRAIFDALHRQAAQAVRAGQPFSLLIMDIDHFKNVNDQYGHQAGDVVLQHVAEVIRGRLRAQDIAGRLGGEEFVAVLPNTGPEGALRIAEELRLTLAGSPAIVDGREILVTTSIGVFGARRLVAADTPDAMMSTADQALYRAKRSGRNRVEAGEQTPGAPGRTGAPKIA